MRSLTSQFRSIASYPSPAAMAKATTSSNNGGAQLRPRLSLPRLTERQNEKTLNLLSSLSLSPSQKTAPAAPSQLLCRLGVLADVQAADRDDAPSFSGVTRRYRDALLTARDSALLLSEDAEVDLLLHLGDLVDMSESGKKPREVLSQVLSALGESGKEQAHVLGNHCLASWPGSRAELHSELGLFGDASRVKGEGESDDGEEFLVSRACPERGYYSRSFGKSPERKGLRLISLDGFDVSMMGREPGHPKRALAESILREKNPRNEAGGWFSAEGLTGTDRRFVCFNGGCGAEQLSWLRSQLEAAESQGQRVVVAVHQPLLPGTANPLCLLWNYDEVLEVLRPFGGERRTVVATLAGHAHSDGAGICDGGIVHRVVRGIVEHERKPTSSSSPCHAVVDVFRDGSVVIRGQGCDDTEHLRTSE